jgi:hypothetical protein
LFYKFLADLVVVLHSFFVLFVLLGGFLVLWKPSVAWYHLPAVFWAAWLEFSGWICPLTPLENLLRGKGGTAGYNVGFVEHYIVPVLYPASLTRQMQVIIGIVVVILNFGIYFNVWMRMRKLRRNQD